jgi:hypothetical protein
LSTVARTIQLKTASQVAVQGFVSTGHSGAPCLGDQLHFFDRQEPHPAAGDDIGYFVAHETGAAILGDFQPPGPNLVLHPLIENQHTVLVFTFFEGNEQTRFTGQRPPEPGPPV